jgi:hypothetical protein
MTGALAPGVATALEDLPNQWLAKPFQVEEVLALFDEAPVIDLEGCRRDGLVPELLDELGDRPRD